MGGVILIGFSASVCRFKWKSPNYFVSVTKGSFASRSPFFSMKGELWQSAKNRNEMNKYMTVCTVFQISSARALKFHEASWDLLRKQYPYSICCIINSPIVCDKVYKPITLLNHTKLNDLSLGDLLAELFMLELYDVME